MTEPITNRLDGRHFLMVTLAIEISCTRHDTFVSKTFEIHTPEGTEVWIERESRLDEPEYWYQLYQYQGEPEPAASGIVS